MAEASQKLHIKVITPASTLFEEDVDGVIVPTAAGQITVLPNHTYLVSILSAGELVLLTKDEQRAVAVAGGTIEMFENTLIILADSAVHPDDIDVEEAKQRAEELAKEIAEQTTMDLSTYHRLEKMLEHERAKLAVAQKWRKL